ncbi:LamB/YcsF family protein [Paenibacillus radicis (ex Xue et al. 2023)]|uniref:5-oxoprolinase subunit A n=1 Tax=Paenibacillus radicis (ex Xue et al. 2023) TaxID=2972489 RepID=A0ABT1YUT1_9BACL|nr:5-oxoprolinase subunit PxpA [Paenibacillus radicis (ex Xue et al. 2023)]MCR8636659.1 LamB/YcsF family protein [Paenibacillus radicis (ex Xue et al. 2023)]
MSSIDLNCDMGESFGAYQLGQDEALMKHITSANIACGYHAGDPAVMRRTVRKCLDNGVAIGAHPGLPDLSGFGRRAMQVTAEEAYEMTVYQIGALWGFVRAEGSVLQHVKPHGALYNMASVDAALSEAIAEAVYRIDPELILFGLAGSELVKAGSRIGLRVAGEVFADRTYRADGTLTPRTEPHALLHDADAAADQVIGMVNGGNHQGSREFWMADTVCIHGDGPHALQFAVKIRKRLELAGIAVRALKI